MSRAGLSPSADLLSTTDLLSSGSSVNRPRAVRWALWLTAGIGFGLLAGFVAGLSRPQVLGRTGPDHQAGPDVETRPDDRVGTDGTADADTSGDARSTDSTNGTDR